MPNAKSLEGYMTDTGKLVRIAYPETANDCVEHINIQSLNGISNRIYIQY